jgi:hypothetical protein
VLDLGCGSENPHLEDAFHPDTMYEPWMCRALHLLGAYPIGIDIGTLKGEKFRHREYTDLSLPGSLDFIPDASVDMANATQLFSSTHLSLHLKISPEMLGKILYPQLERVCKPDAYFLVRD